MSDEDGFGRMILKELEENQDIMGEISIEDITNCIPSAARALEFETNGGRDQLVKKTKEHLEAEKSLGGKLGEELKEAKRKLAKQRRRYRARRIILSLQMTKKRSEGCKKPFV